MVDWFIAAAEGLGDGYMRETGRWEVRSKTRGRLLLFF